MLTKIAAEVIQEYKNSRNADAATIESLNEVVTEDPATAIMIALGASWEDNITISADLLAKVRSELGHDPDITDWVDKILKPTS